jgi:uncharacterized membrane protein YidH (DUF202 family)
VTQLEVGLSAQRTRMAWRRTAMSAAAVALLAARPAVAGAGPVQVLVAAAAMAGWVALVAFAYRRGRGLDARPPQPGRRTLLACAGACVGFAVIGVVLVLA